MTNETIESMANEVKLPLIRTGLIALAFSVVVAIIGGLVSVQRGDAIGDGLWTLLATIPGVLIPIGILTRMPSKPAGEWGVPVLMGTMIRAMVVLTIGIALYMVIDPARVVFFLTLLSALMGMLLIDVLSVLSLIQKHATGLTPVVDAEGIS
jgi:energy-converting hydrogenase Eha subunit A